MAKQKSVFGFEITRKKSKKKSDKTDLGIVEELNRLHLNHINQNLMSERRLFRQFYDGKQWPDENTYDKSWLEQNVQDRKRIDLFKLYRTTVNVTAQVLETLLGIFVGTMPSVTAKSFKQGISAKQSTQAVNLLLQRFFQGERFGWQTRLEEALLGAMIEGLSWLYVSFDDMGVGYTDDQGGKGKIGEFKVEAFQPGAVEVLNPARNYQEIEEVLFIRRLPLAKIEKKYGITASTYGRDTALPAISLRNEVDPEQETYGVDTVLVWDYYLRAGVDDDHPKGRFVRIINKEKVVVDEENPYADLGELGEYSIPFFPINWNASGKELEGRSALLDIIPLQRNINTIESLLLYNARLTAAIKVAFPKGSGVKTGDYSSLPGVLEYDGTYGQPVKLGAEPVASYIAELARRHKGEMSEILGVHDVSQGRAPSRVSGYGIELLIGQEQMRHSRNMMRMGETILSLARFVLLGMQKFYTQKRFVKVFGGANWYLTEFKEADLDGVFDVQLEAATLSRRSMAARLEFAWQLWDREILPAALQTKDQTMQRAARTVLNILDMGDIGEGFKYEQIQRSRAAHIVREFQEGSFPDVLISENPGIMIEELEQFSLGPDFADLGEERQTAILERIVLYKKILQGVEEGQLFSQEDLAGIQETGTVPSSPPQPGASGEQAGMVAPEPGGPGAVQGETLEVE
jgi:hypothetical protein